MALEASKSRERLQRYIQLPCIDIGAGIDLIHPEAQRWDLEDGDAQTMKGLEHESFVTVFSSHCIEHMRDPQTAMLNWWRLVKPGGYLVVVMPDEDLYEQHIWPSAFNDDHKSSLTPHKDISWSPTSRNLLDLIEHLPQHQLLSIVRQDTNYNYNPEGIYDQSRIEGTEVSIEMVLRKQTQSDGQRFSRASELAYCPICHSSIVILNFDSVKGILGRCVKCGQLVELWPKTFGEKPSA